MVGYLPLLPVPMRLVPVQVESEEVGETDQIPRRFFWEGDWMEVEEVEDRWYQGPGNLEWPMAEYFKVMGSDLREYLLKRDLEDGEWYLIKRW